MSRRVLLLLVASTAALAGCGGERPPEEYVFDATLACLRQEVGRVSTADVDFVASTALGGAVYVRFPGRTNEVTLSFGESEEDAARIEQAYRRFAPKRVRIGDVLRRNRNVVLLWGVTPTEQQETTVGGCLRA